jgi:hypothetical protein
MAAVEATPKLGPAKGACVFPSNDPVDDDFLFALMTGLHGKNR